MKNLLPYFQLNAHTLTKHILSEYEVALFLQFLKIKRHQYPFIYVLKVSIIITEQKWHL